MNLAVEADLLVGLLLAMVRAAAWLLLTPPFTGRAVPVAVKVALALGLALPVAPHLAASAPEAEPAPLVAAVLIQVGAGLGLGFVTLVLLSAVQAAGDLVDLFTGFTMASLFDPLSGASSAIFGRFYQLVATLLLFVTNGHLLLVRGFLRSFDAVPARTPGLRALTGSVIDDVGTFFVAALEIAGPLLAALVLADVALGLLSRAAPLLNVFVLGMPVKVLVTLLLVGLTLTVLPGAVRHLVEEALASMAAVAKVAS